MLLVGRQKGIRPVKKLSGGVLALLSCLERGADLRVAQLMPLPLSFSCFSKIQIGFTFLVPAHPGSPGQRAVKLGCVSVVIAITIILSFNWLVCLWQQNYVRHYGLIFTAVVF